MKRPAVIITAALALSLTLAGCGSPGTGASEQRHNGASELQHNGADKAPRNPDLNERGNLVRHAGDTVRALDSKGKVQAEWTVTGIVTDPTCTAPDSEPPENGHFVELDMQARLSNDSAGDLMDIGSPATWRFIHKDGTLWSGNTGSFPSYGCLPAEERMPGTLIRGTKAEGKVIFDVPSLEGSLYYEYDGGNHGWEYPIR